MPNDTIIRNNIYVLAEKPTAEKIAGALNKVRPLTLSVEETRRLGLPSQKVFYKKIRDLENSADLILVLQYQIAAANLYRRFLGADFAPEIRLVVGTDGKPKGIISSEMPNFKPLSEVIEEKVNSNLSPILSKFPSNSEIDVRDFRRPHLFPETVVHPLVSDGLVKLAVVSYFVANRNGNYDNFGYTNQENSSNGNICNVAFDQALWPLVERFYMDQEDTEAIEDKAKKRFPLKKYYLGANFVELPHEEYFAWFNKNSFSCESRIDPEYVKTPALTYAVNTAPNYTDDQFFQFLKIIFTPPQDIEEDISVIEDEEEKIKLFNFLEIRTKKWILACFDNDEFCNWLLVKKESVEQRLLDSFKNNDRLELIKTNFRIFLGQVAEEFSDHSFDDFNNSGLTDSQDFTSLSGSEHESENHEAVEQKSINLKHGTSPHILLAKPKIIESEVVILQPASSPNPN